MPDVRERSILGQVVGATRAPTPFRIRQCKPEAPVIDLMTPHRTPGTAEPVQTRSLVLVRRGADERRPQFRHGPPNRRVAQRNPALQARLLAPVGGGSVATHTTCCRQAAWVARCYTRPDEKGTWAIAAASGVSLRTSNIGDGRIGRRTAQNP